MTKRRNLRAMYTPEHKTTKIVIKRAEVDREMVPIVRWLNSFKDIITTYCCQGDENNQPYVIFYCSSQRALAHVVKIIGAGPGCAITVDMLTGESYLRYNIQWQDQETFKLAVDRVKYSQQWDCLACGKQKLH